MASFSGHVRVSRQWYNVKKTPMSWTEIAGKTEGMDYKKPETEE